MFEKTTEAATKLAGAVAEDVTQAAEVAKAAVVPAVAGLFGTLGDYANKLKEGIESGDLFKPKAEDQPNVAAVPTEEQTKTINVLRKAGKTNAEIAEFLGLSPLTVNMAIDLEA